MTDLTENALDWSSRLESFIDDRRGHTDLPDREGLAQLDDWKRRITGGNLIQFLEFVQSPESFQHFPALRDNPIEKRVFVSITDVPGAVAAREIVDDKTPAAIIALKDEWRQWIAQGPGAEDIEFQYHYECWSVWHRDIEPEWDIEAPEIDRSDTELWVHQEGFALADGAGRGAQHLWAWDGESMEKLQEQVESWVSAPEAGPGG